MGFKKDFIWGAATASYQIEGAWNEDGKGPNIWDRYSHEPGHVLFGHTGDVACDHYHRYEQDADLMREIGVRNYRMSLSWARLLPEGVGAVNQKGVDFYNRLFDALESRGIRPFVTLFHWDYPCALQDKGAWSNPDSVKWFEEYTALCADKFGGRVKDFFTFNEPQCFIGAGYEAGFHAPGVKLGPACLMPMIHNVMKAHGAAVHVLRETVPGCRVGYVPCSSPAIPATNDPADIEAARKSYFDISEDGHGLGFNVPLWSDPVMLGRYPEKAISLYGQHLPRGWENDLPGMHQKLDYYAQNIYQGHVVRAADNAKGYESVPLPVGFTKTAIQWPVTPDALYWGPKFLYERYKTPFVIAENGLSCHDTVSLDGKVHDPNREDFLHRYLLAYKRAAQDGVDAAGYFAWSLMDNYEWANGYTDRFGLIYVNYQTQERIIKDSAYWYKAVMESNGETL